MHFADDYVSLDHDRWRNATPQCRMKTAPRLAKEVQHPPFLMERCRNQGFYGTKWLLDEGRWKYPDAFPEAGLEFFLHLPRLSDTDFKGYGRVDLGRCPRSALEALQERLQEALPKSHSAQQNLQTLRSALRLPKLSLILL